MKTIDEELKTALKDAAIDCGSVLKLSRKLKVSHSTVLFWSSGRTRRIDGDVWRYKVYPVLEPYLRRRGGRACLADFSAGYGLPAVEGSPSEASMHSVPVIGIAQAAGFDPALEPFDVYARGCGEASCFFATEPKSGYFALRVEGSGLEPVFPDGTLILVAGGEFVESGDVVAARLRESGAVVVKRLSRSGDEMRLEPLEPGGVRLSWNRRADRGFVEWMHPVVEAKVDLRVKRGLGSPSPFSALA